MDLSESSSSGAEAGAVPPVANTVPLQVPPVLPTPRVQSPCPPQPAVHGNGRTQRPRGGAWKWVAVGVSVMLIISLLALGLIVVGKSDRNWTHHRSTQSPGAAELQEVLVRDSPCKDKVAVISLEGVISGEILSDIGSSMVELVSDQLERAAVEGVSAVILKVDSPGGEVLASDEIYLLLEKFQKENDIPVVASMGSLAASGGYYVSAPCRWIVANELTMTGSIGVIFHSYNYRGLMDKLGVRPDITKSGKLKDMMSGEKLPEEILPEERAILQGMIDESFAKFKDIIRTGRNHAAGLNLKDGLTEGRKLASNWTEFADGRILSGQQALNLGLVDELGNFEVALDRVFQLARLDGAKLVTYQPHFRFPGFLSLLGQARSGSVKVDLGLPLQSRLPEGRLYFMSPLHMH